MKNHFTVQIYTGEIHSAPQPLDIPALISKFEQIYQKAHLDCVMIGENPDAEIDELADYLRQRGTDVYLWLSVFSGHRGLSALVNPQNKPVRQDYDPDDEKFVFGCPGNPENIRYIKQIFEKYYQRRKYDGIFLDKIRFPGFSCGTEPVFTCFCPHCRANYPVSDRIQIGNGENPLGITGYGNLKYTLADKNLDDLFAYKAEAVTASLISLIAYFREKKYKIGLDLFAPFLSYFVGQDYAALAPYADFIKPMFYRKTYAPAGLPFEIDKYANAFGGSLQEIEKRRLYLYKMLQTSAIDMSFINREIKAMRSHIGTAKLYSGIEVNYHEKIAPVKASYIKENIRMTENVDGFALSWDLCGTPDENLKAALDAGE